MNDSVRRKRKRHGARNESAAPLKRAQMPRESGRANEYGNHGAHSNEMMSPQRAVQQHVSVRGA
jgi:hypothetical protein